MKKRISITIDEDVLDRVREKADKSNRNVSNMIQTLCAEGLKKLNLRAW